MTPEQRRERFRNHHRYRRGDTQATPDEKKEKKAAYMKEYWRKRKESQREPDKG